MTTDPIWDQLVALFGEPRMASTRALYGKARKEFTAAGYTPSEMRRAAHEYQKQWPQAAFTITAFLKHADHMLAAAGGDHVAKPRRLVPLDSLLTDVERAEWKDAQ